MTMRPIDAEALEEKIENLITRFKALGRKQVAEDYNFVLTVLSTAPTIEAKPVVHAHWEYIGESDGKKIYCCTNCKTNICGTGNYCKECGAQMDEKEMGK